MLVRKPLLLVACVGLSLCGCGKSTDKPTSEAGATGAANAIATDASEIDSTTGPRIPAQEVTVERNLGGTTNENQAGDQNSPSGQLASDAEELEMEFDEESDFEDGIKDLAENEQESPELNPEEGTPEWNVREIVKILAEPLPETDKPEEIRKEQITRNRKVVILSREAIKGIHDDPKKSRVFEVAIHRMIDSQAALALLGDPEGTDGLYDTAKSLYERDAKSKLAVDAFFTLVNVSFTNAHRTAGKDNRWVKEYARLARVFTKNFPQDSRSASMLYNAALGCEWNGLNADAEKTYAVLGEKFPETPQGKMVPGVQRRMKLVGEKLALSGPSLKNGEEISIASEPGKVTVVVFWSASSEECRRVLPIVNEMAAKNKSLQLAGVCVDEDAKQASLLAKELGLKWPQICYQDKEQSGWKNPIVKEYSVMDVSAWVVSEEGTITSTSIPLGSLEQHLSSLLKRDASREK